jgi:hypothetical protein
VIAYESQPWHDLFTPQRVRPATLAGLTFVAVSLSHELEGLFP